MNIMAEEIDEVMNLLEVEPAAALPGGGNWVNFCWVCAAGHSEPLPHYSLFCG